MLLFLTLSVLWTALWLAVRHGLSWWRERWFLQPAHYISDIKRVSYFRQLPESQLERLALNALTAHKYLLLGDPILGRAKVQGYAWRAGKKVVIVLRREKPLTVNDLHKIHRLKNKAKAERALVVSPFSHAPQEDCPGVEILSGKKLLAWMKVLDQVKPVKTEMMPPQICSCGSPMQDFVSRAGEPLLVCSMRPDCNNVVRPTRALPEVPVSLELPFVRTIR